MILEGNPLDLNNLPDDFSREGKKVLQDSSSSECREKKSREKDGKVYECRFCSHKFCKSQALGGHMNRHRQERETETLNHARRLVYRSDQNPHLGCCQAVVPGSYHPASTMGDLAMPMRFPSYFSGSSSTHIPHPLTPALPQPSQPYLYASTSPPVSFPSHFSQNPPVNDYYVGHVLSSSHHNLNYVAAESSYTSIVAPVGQRFATANAGSGRGSEGGGERDLTC